MASKAIQKSAAKKKILAASSTTSSAKTKVEIAGEKKENVAPESVEEVFRIFQATESIVQPKLEDKANKAEPKPKTPVKSTSKSTAAASKTNVRNPVSVKKSAPLTKASKST
ncbi:hypothetical protein GCK32_008562 [Trichostrongylus colubriformis]|uniref:Uncharacterized protein n=1 Tax=Trichostrongylus colubriformis TaxID=6319 RepID=A0AAN8IIP0_TRICO